MTKSQIAAVASAMAVALRIVNAHRVSPSCPNLNEAAMKAHDALLSGDLAGAWSGLVQAQRAAGKDGQFSLEDRIGDVLNMMPEPEAATPLTGWTLITPVDGQKCGILIPGSQRMEPWAGTYYETEEGPVFLPDSFPSAAFAMRVFEGCMFTSSAEAAPIVVVA